MELGACVEFSSCLCVQYGPGVTDAKVDIVHSLREMEPTRPSDDVSPYPVLEMRIVNTVSTCLFDVFESNHLDHNVSAG